ncbi:MAG: LysM peptidoglycan-binding domain-containing protein [Polyangiales bacterium]
MPRRWLHGMIALMLCFATMLASAVGVQAESTTLWIVRPGDALSILAERFGVSVAAIKENNRLKSDLIWIGQKLSIPTTKKPTEHNSAEPKSATSKSEPIKQDFSVPKDAKIPTASEEPGKDTKLISEDALREISVRIEEVDPWPEINSGENDIVATEPVQPAQPIEDVDAGKRRNHRRRRNQRCGRGCKPDRTRSYATRTRSLLQIPRRLRATRSAKSPNATT